MTDRTAQLPVIILGAGVCGLYAARVLSGQGMPVIIIEKETAAGGLSVGFERNGNYYDLGVHHLHGSDHEILLDLQYLMGERLKPVELSALIRYGKGFYHYPLQFGDLLSGIPPRQLIRALTGLFHQQIKNQFDKTAAADAEEALIEIYGRPLYEYFFKDFTHAYWGFPARELSAGFVRSKMPRLNAVDVIKDNLKKLGFRFQEEPAAGALSRETLWYSPTGSRELTEVLSRTVEKNGGKIFKASPVIGIDTEDGRVTTIRFNQSGSLRTLPCSYCLSTIPLPELIRALYPKPAANIISAGEQLRYKPIAIFGLLIRKPKVMDALYIHFRDRIFHRLAEPKNSGLVVRPKDCTVLIAEMTCQVGDDRWRGGAVTRAKLIEDLAAEHLLVPQDILEIHHVTALHAYPVFYLGFEKYYQEVMVYLQRIQNLRSIGRQGGFSYPNMHSAMRMGADAAGEILRQLIEGKNDSGSTA